MSSRIPLSTKLLSPSSSVPMPAMTTADTDTIATAAAATATTTGLSNKQLALLLVAAPVVVGAGAYLYYSYYHNNNNKKGSPDGKSGDKKNKNTTTKIKTKDAMDGISSEMDPLTAALKYKSNGNDMFRDHRYQEAIDCYTRAIDSCPADRRDELSTFYQNRAASYEMLKSYQLVVDDCDKALALNNRYVKAMIRRAKAKEALGDLSGALFDITAVCILEQFQNQPNLMMTDRLLREQSKIKAKTLFKTRTPRLPSNHFIVHYFMSYSNEPILKNCGPTEVVQYLETLREKQTESDHYLHEFLLLDATLEILKGNIENGEKLLDRLIGFANCMKDIKVNALIKLGTIRVQDIGREDSFKDALDCFDRAVQLDDKNPDIYLHRAQIYLLSERVDDAYKDLEKCCKLNDKFASAFAQKLYVQYRCGVRYNDETTICKALQGFELAMDQFSSSSEVYSLYAQALMERGDYSKADEYFQKAIDKDPDDGNLYVHRGILYLQSTNETDKAIKLLEKAMKADPSCQFAYEMMGTIQVQKGLLANGIKSFDKALELAQTELDCAHLYSLRDAAEAQEKATKLLGIELPVPSL